MDNQLNADFLTFACSRRSEAKSRTVINKIIKDIKPYVELSKSTLYTILKRLGTSSMLTVVPPITTVIPKASSL